MRIQNCNFVAELAKGPHTDSTNLPAEESPADHSPARPDAASPGAADSQAPQHCSGGIGKREHAGPPGFKRQAMASRTSAPVDLWPVAATIAANNFIYKSLSQWAFNVAVGCSHACRFCYVPDAAANKQAPRLAAFGVSDPDAQWGEYLLLRTWNEGKFLASLRQAQRTPKSKLKRDGNRAVIYCSTTDAYQVIHHPEPERRRELADHLRWVVRHSLELIRDHSTLNVRVLTRSPLARQDFDLFRSFGPRLLFGVSLPTLRNDLARVYEPKAPSPSQRLKLLREAKAAGLHVFVAMAPTYPECDEADLRRTLTAIRQVEPLTVFHEPINIRAENVARIRERGVELNVKLRTEVFDSHQAWQEYAVGALKAVETIAREVGLGPRLHLWPDKNLGSQAHLKRQPDPQAFQTWLNQYWTRISEWPKASRRPMLRSARAI